MTTKRILVTGGMGFIGSALVRRLLQDDSYFVGNIDNLSYSANPTGLAYVNESPRLRARYLFFKEDIREFESLQSIFQSFRPDFVIHTAAETHVDRSIDSPAPFISTNILGTYNLLEAARKYFDSLDVTAQGKFRFLHVSTDEVYGSVSSQKPASEQSVYRTNSPYSASKAASDHLVYAWHKTFGLPILISHCSNNYGPYQFPEKLIPLCLLKAFSGEAIPIFGRGKQMRDWIHVTDHVEALLTILLKGNAGETYNVGIGSSIPNLELVELLCSCLDVVSPRAEEAKYRDLITFVKDRAGHDFCYALASNKVRKLGWRPKITLKQGLLDTVRWYSENRNWVNEIRAEKYNGQRLGVAA